MEHLASLKEETGDNVIETSSSQIESTATATTAASVNVKPAVNYFQSPVINTTMLNSLAQIKPLSLIDGKKKAFVIGISGGVSAGKSIITNLVFQSLKTKFNLIVANLVQSQFYKDLPVAANKDDDVKTNYNFDEPNAVDWDHLYEAVNNLIDNKPFSAPVYDMVQEKRSTEKQLYRSADVIIVEGTLIFTQERIRDLFDLKIFLDTDEDVRLSRRIFKSVCVQNKDIDRTVGRYLKFSKVGFEKYTLPSKKYADIIIPNYGGGYSASHTEEILAGFGTVDNAAIEVIINQIVSKRGQLKEELPK